MAAGPRGQKPFAYHEILGVEVSTPQDQLRAAYRKRALQLHPDKNINNPNSEEDFKLLNAAFHVLNDPNERCAYERECKTWQFLSPDGVGQQSPPTVHEDAGLRYFLRVVPDALFGKFQHGQEIPFGSLYLVGGICFGLTLGGYMALETLFQAIYWTPILANLISIPVGAITSNSLTEFTSYVHGSLASTVAWAFPEYLLYTYLYWVIGSNIHTVDFRPLEGPIRQLMKLTSNCTDLVVKNISDATTWTSEVLLSAGISVVNGGASLLEYYFHHLFRSTKYFSPVPRKTLEYVAEEWVMLEGADGNDQSNSSREVEASDLDLSDWIELE